MKGRLSTRSWLIFGLAVLVALAIVVGAPGANPSPRMESVGGTPTVSGTDSTAGRVSRDSRLPSRIARVSLSSAERDPFQANAPVAQPAPPVPAPVAPLPEIARPKPALPRPEVSFAGRMIAPDGEPMTFLKVNSQVVAVTAGQMLPNNFRVDAVSETSVDLSYLPSGAKTRLELPTAPRYETR